MNLVFWRNAEEIRADLNLRLTENLHLRAEYHHFRLHRATDAWYNPSGPVRRDATGESGRALGHEADLTLRSRLHRRALLLTGVSRFFPSEFVRRTGPAPKALWLFCEITFER